MRRDVDGQRDAESASKLRRRRLLHLELHAVAAGRESGDGLGGERRSERHDDRLPEGAGGPVHGREAVDRGHRAGGGFTEERRRGGRAGDRRRAGRADDGGVDVARVDVDRRAVPGLVVRTAVLMDPLVVRPERVRDVRVAEHALVAVPVGDPDVVGRGARRSERLQVANRRARAAVDAREVAERVQLVHPAGHERLHGLAARRVVDRVALHVEVDRAARREPERVRVVRGVVGRGRSLARRERGGDLCDVRAADAGRLEADVERDQVPPGRDGAGRPGRRELGVRAGAIGAADVDAERPVGRGEPGVQRVELGRVARVEGVALEGGRLGRARRGRPAAGQDEAEPRRKHDATQSSPVPANP